MCYYISKIILTLVLVFSIEVLLSQTYLESCAYENLFLDSLIKSEIVCIKQNYDRLIVRPKPYFTEVKLKKCSENFAVFEKGNLYTSKIIVTINSGISESLKYVEELFIIHYKYGFNLPDSVLNDITNPMFCKSYSYKEKPNVKNCHVFQTTNKERLYICLSFWKNYNQYKVIWIINNWKYYGREIFEL